MNHVFIIAEAGVNHNGDINLAKKLQFSRGGRMNINNGDEYILVPKPKAGSSKKKPGSGDLKLDKKGLIALISFSAIFLTTLSR